MPQILNSLQVRFFEVTTNEQFSKPQYQMEMRSVVLDCLECLCGVAQGSRMDNLERLFHYFTPILQEIVKVLGNNFYTQTFTPCKTLSLKVKSKSITTIVEIISQNSKHNATKLRFCQILHYKLVF